MATKRKLSAISPDSEQALDPAEELMFLCLGGGNEVGRSCHVIQYKGKTVMVGVSYRPKIIFWLTILVHSLMPVNTLLSMASPHYHILMNLISAQSMFC